MVFVSTAGIKDTLISSEEKKASQNRPESIHGWQAHQERKSKIAD